MKAPWTDEQVKKLKAWQANDRYHAFTCPGHHNNCFDHRKLIPTNEGWICACGEYRQDWAHDFMVND
jgi:hypothetical protein